MALRDLGGEPALRLALFRRHRGAPSRHAVGHRVLLARGLVLPRRQALSVLQSIQLRANGQRGVQLLPDGGGVRAELSRARRLRERLLRGHEVVDGPGHRVPQRPLEIDALERSEEERASRARLLVFGGSKVPGTVPTQLWPT